MFQASLVQSSQDLAPQAKLLLGQRCKRSRTYWVVENDIKVAGCEHETTYFTEPLFAP